MSASNDNNEKVGAKDAPVTTTDNAISPAVEDPRKVLREGIRSGVRTTNTALASLEDATHNATSTMMSRFTALARQLRPAFQRTLDLYDSRAQYGPQIVAGTVFAFGGLAAMRRGRIPGAFIGVLSGSAAYAGVYGIDLFTVDEADKKRP